MSSHESQLEAKSEAISPEIEQAIALAESDLRQVDATPFSPSAFKLLTEAISQYIRELTVESAKTARRHKVDTISATHVTQAQQYLVSSQTRPVLQHVGTVGGIFFGAAISNVLTLISSDQISALGVAITALLLILGAFLVALHVGKDLK